MRAGDQSLTQQQLGRLQDSLGRAHSRSSGPLWAAATWLPWVGDDVDAVRTVSATGDELSHGTLKELVPLAGPRLLQRLVPRDGRVDTGAVARLAPPLRRASSALERADDRLSSVDPGGLSGFVTPSFDGVAASVRELRQVIDAADRAVRVLPTLLGQDRPRDFLLMFDNNAEIRATGGLPGAYAIVHTERGRISLARQGAGAAIPEFARPVLPQSTAESTLYGTQPAVFFVDTNVVPDFGRTADLARAMWRRQTGQRLDGVMSLDTVSLSYLLDATGPVRAPGGVTLTRQNALRELLSQVYVRLVDPADQDAFFQGVAKRVFDAVNTGGGSPAKLVSALAQASSEGRVYVHSFDRAEQKALSGSAVAGETRTVRPDEPEVHVTLNDATGSKMSYYLRSRAAMTSGACDSSGRQELSGHLDLTYTADSPPVAQLPAYVTGTGQYGTPKGEQLVLVHVYGPARGEITQLRVAGEPVDPDVVSLDGRPVTVATAQLRRGQTVRVSWRILTAAGQRERARLWLTPGVETRPVESTVPSRCG